MCKKAKETCVRQKKNNLTVTTKRLTCSPKETRAYIYKKPMLK